MYVLEIWGDRTDYENCFRQFNPKPENLLSDLERLFPLYYEVVQTVIRSTLGIAFDPKNPVPAARVEVAVGAADAAAIAAPVDQLHAELDRIEQSLLQAQQRLQGWRRGQGFV